MTAAVVTVAVLGAASSAQASTKWLCGPGVSGDPCRPSLSTTVYRGWGERTGTVTPKRDRDRGVDCFYVYPTVSDQQTRLATKRVDPELRSIALYQAALGKSGVDANTVNMHLGMALAQSGDRAGAEAALRKVTGPRAEVAGLWLAWLARGA